MATSPGLAGSVRTVALVLGYWRCPPPRDHWSRPRLLAHQEHSGWRRCSDDESRLGFRHLVAAQSVILVYFSICAAYCRGAETLVLRLRSPLAPACYFPFAGRSRN
jgi:hypothetical protein